MLDLAFAAAADDDVILKAHVRCRSCLGETFPLVPVPRPPGGASALAVFVRRRMFERMPFRCDTCGHGAADLVAIDYAGAADVVQAPEQLARPMLPRLSAEFAQHPKAYELRDRRTGVSLGSVEVAAPEGVLAAFLADCGMTAEDFAAGFGSPAEARAALEIVEVPSSAPAPERRQATRPLSKALPLRRAFYQEVTT